MECYIDCIETGVIDLQDNLIYQCW